MPKEKIDAAVMDPEMQAFAQDVLTSIQQAQRGEGRVHQVPLSAAAEARAKVGLTQTASCSGCGVDQWRGAFR